MITIAHLYHDLMNLYGESGNVKALKFAFESMGIKTNVILLSINDKLEFDKYDFIYMGAGTENNQKIVLQDLSKYKKEIKEAYENGTYFLMTGNALELFGEKILFDNDELKGINLFPFTTTIENFRIVDEAYMNSNIIKKPIIGFQNHSGMIDNIDTPLFEVIKGTGYKPNTKYEGIHNNNFFGTYIIGPILVRNPELLKYFVNNLLKKKNIKPVHKLNLNLDIKAYNEFIKNYYSEK